MEQQLIHSQINQYSHYAHSVGVMMLHLEWKPKYAYKMFGKEDQKNLISACIRRAASLHNIKIIVLSVMPEHIHISVEIPPTMSQSKALQLLKGGLSYQLFRANEHFRLRYPRGHFFSPGALANSTGYNTVETVDNYVKNQKYVHQKLLTAF